MIRFKILRESLIATRQFVVAVVVWAFSLPLTLFIKRRPELIVIIGRGFNSFTDNAKYFYAYATEHAVSNEQFVFLSMDKNVHQAVTSAGGSTVMHPSLRSFLLLLRCGTVVTDGSEWHDHAIFPLTHKARLVQIWHGAPLKHIELDVYRGRLSKMPGAARIFFNVQKAVIGRYPRYDVLIATSQTIVDQAFTSSFRAKKYVVTGYPRNDILLGLPGSNSVSNTLLKVNVDWGVIEAAERAKQEGKMVCLYVPTFRKDLSDPFVNHLDLGRLSKFSQQHNLLFILKLHPYMHSKYKIENYPNLLQYAPLADVYPLMSLCDILITDYSSIFFDFLLLDRPILFYAYDLGSYLSQDRAMYFSYEDLTPGARCSKYGDLEKCLQKISDNGGKDNFSEERDCVRRKVHDYQDNQSARRLLQLIRRLPVTG